MSSVVWNFFKKIDKQNVSCNLCGKNYKSSGNTSNLSAHLKSKHHYAFVQIKTSNSRTRGANKLQSSEDSETIEPHPKRVAQAHPGTAIAGCSFTRGSTMASTTSSTSTISISTEAPADTEECPESGNNDDTTTEENQNRDVWKQATLMDVLERSSSYEGIFQ
ncbi:uncharacterized protein LOC123322116 isoform X2 [Coccinella septempunctata]|uniref:uncharacterized protein LOC123322116 isoform X2 n=1 Tax=Coccinella septempunctata TaxID=41139 RepID=UPI001D061976|nr:uncharacterized protein LOC123322116 isoform X2 [Coccinella septempunctata]